MPIFSAHVFEVERLPRPHNDPFDRILAAQSRVEAAELVTADPIFGQYSVKVIW